MSVIEKRVHNSMRNNHKIIAANIFALKRASSEQNNGYTALYISHLSGLCTYGHISSQDYVDGIFRKAHHVTQKWVGNCSALHFGVSDEIHCLGVFCIFLSSGCFDML